MNRCSNNEIKSNVKIVIQKVGVRTAIKTFVNLARTDSEMKSVEKLEVIFGMMTYVAEICSERMIQTLGERTYVFPICTKSGSCCGVRIMRGKFFYDIVEEIEKSWVAPTANRGNLQSKSLLFNLNCS